MSETRQPFRVIDGGLSSDRDDRVEAAWRRYIDAQRRAEASHDIRDGIEAGRAWGAWLSLFERRAG